MGASIVGGPNAISAGAVKLMREVVAEAVAAAAPRIKGIAQTLVGQGMQASPEYASLVNGKLREEFGIADAAAAIGTIIAAVQLAVGVSRIRGTGDHLGGVSVGVFRAEFADALGAPGARYTSVSRRLTALIPWLEWLLFAGAERIILGSHTFRPGHPLANSRTGYMVMATPKSGKSRGWGVPPEFAGTAEENWLTRVADDMTPSLLDAIVTEIGL